MLAGSVLVIDDKPQVAGFVARILRDHGMVVETAQSAAGGLERAQRGGFDVVIFDLLTGGNAALAAMRRALPEQPVLVLSPRSDIHSRSLCLEVGASDYLARPFAPAELLARVRIQLRRPRAGRRRDDALCDMRSAAAIQLTLAAHR
jgi:DNA-binding response OmpR family regulator